jgi:hypothetical protein
MPARVNPTAAIITAIIFIIVSPPYPLESCPVIGVAQLLVPYDCRQTSGLPMLLYEIPAARLRQYRTFFAGRAHTGRAHPCVASDDRVLQPNFKKIDVQQTFVPGDRFGTQEARPIGRASGLRVRLGD